MKKISEIIKILIKAKYNLKKPQKKKIIIFDDKGSVGIFSKFFLPGTFDILHVRGEKINIFVILTIIFRLKVPSLKKYIIEYLKFVKPKYVFHNTYNRRFFEIDNNDLNFDIIKIFTQDEKKSSSSYREFNINNKNYHSDYLFVENEAMKNHMKKDIKGEYIINGLFNNNTGPKINLLNLKEKIQFISQYRTFKSISKKYSKEIKDGYITEDTILDQVDDVKYSYNQFYQTDLDIAFKLKKFCEKENIHFEVVGTSSDDQEGEVKFFSSVLGNKNWNYVGRRKNIKGYHLTADAKYIVTIDSTLGHECFSRGQRVCFFSVRSKYIKSPYSIFGWPKILPQEGKCWTTLNEDKDFDRLTDFLINGKNEDWEKLRYETLKDLFHYDYQNQNYQNFLKFKGIN
jgi:surface carbohydrate biosynthesis protein